MKYLPCLVLAASALGATLALAQAPATPSMAPAAPAAPAVSAPSALPAAPAARPLPPARWTLAQVRESFVLADGDSNGELTRAEAQRLAAMPQSFEEMDENKDGVLARDEYEAAFPR